MSTSKSQMFSPQRLLEFYSHFCAKLQNTDFFRFSVDKVRELCLNRHKQIEKTLKENLSSPRGFREPAVGVSRSGGIGRSGS